MTFAEEGKALQSELVALRRELHQNPEIGLELPATQAAILRELEGLDLEITTGKGLDSVVAVLRGSTPGPSVLLRGDMDALPVDEETGLDYASTNGAMHACGHDLHVTGLVGAAKLLAAHRDELVGDVIFMFQPGEEGPGGAAPMIEEGLLEAAGERPIAAYAIHVAPGVFGTFGTRGGTIMAGANKFEITVHGRGGHGSQPVSAVDPVPALVEIAQALQTMATRKFETFDPIVLSVTQLSAGKAHNVIPASASLGGSARTLSDASLATLQTELQRVADGIAAAHGCTAEVVFEVLYPVTVNDVDETAWAIETLGGEFGGERVLEVPNPVMGSEDFSYVLNEIPGTFLFLQTTPPGMPADEVAYNHSPKVVFDDAVLGDQAAALATLAFERLQKAAAAS